MIKPLIKSLTTDRINNNCKTSVFIYRRLNNLVAYYRGNTSTIQQQKQIKEREKPRRKKSQCNQAVNFIKSTVKSRKKKIALL
jgi:hypothetical protein